MGEATSLEKRQSKLRKTVLGELQFMLHHFTQMLKAASKGNSSLMIAGNHSRLSSFIPHLQQTIDQLHQPLASEEALQKLEVHLERTLLPVKRRLEAQLRQTLPRPHLAGSGSSGDLSKHSSAAAEAAPAPKQVVSDDDEVEMLGDLLDEDDERGDARASAWDERRTEAVVVTESSDSSDSASVHGKATEAEASLPHVSASAPALGARPAKPLAAPLRRRASIQVLPEQVEYHCSSCGELYTARSSTVYNPWWSLVRQACPKCNQCQFPWIDISSATNQITHRPCAALLEEDEAANDDDDDLLEPAAEDDDRRRPPDEADRAPDPAPSPADDALFGADRALAEPIEADDDFAEAPAPDRLSRNQALAVLDLFHHARACPGHHCSSRHADLCAAAKFVMLHARDCRGALPCGRPCPFEWCRAVKRFLAHLVRCDRDRSRCAVCRREADRFCADDDDAAAEPEPAPPRAAGVKRRLDRDDDHFLADGRPLESSLVEPRPSGVPRIIIRKPQPARPPDASLVVLNQHPRKLQRPSFDYWETLNGVIDSPGPPGHLADGFDDAAALNMICGPPPDDHHCAIVG